MSDRSIVTVDLDSTLCDTGHRHRLIDRENGTDWDAYSMACADDVPVQATVVLVTILAETHDIHFVTGRTVAAVVPTLTWLHNVFPDLKFGLWMDETEDGDHFAAYGGHAPYKHARIKDVAEATGKKVVLHIDDWAGVKVYLEERGIPCVAVRTPQEVEELTALDGANLR